MARQSNYKKQGYKRRTGNGRTITVQEPNTLLPFLFEILNQQSKSSVKALLKHGQISVNGRVTSQFDAPLRTGDQIRISYDRGKVEFNSSLLRIVWEDESLLVVDKKEGLLAAGNSKVKERTAFSLLSDYERKNDPRAKLFLLNPLDRDTSGLMLFARNRGVQQQLLDNWNDRITYRSFVAVVEGKPERETGLLTSQIDQEEDAKVFITSTNDARQTILRYKVLKSSEAYSLVEFVYEAGKKNIIKEQMGRIGHPVIGSKWDEETSNPLERVAIHANKLCLKHPETGENLCFESHYPPTFNLIIKQTTTKE